MSNKQKITESYSLLSEMLLDAISDADEAKTYEDIEAILTTVDKLSTILKRVSEITILEDFENTETTSVVKEEVEEL